MRQVGLICCATLLLVVLDTSVVNAECCPPIAEYKCGDGTTATPYCGYGRCNVFGCNCNGGCRRRTRDTPLSDDIVNNYTDRQGSFMDINGDGLVDREEAIRFLRMTGVKSPEAKVSRFDKNGDGYLSNEEMNAVTME